MQIGWIDFSKKDRDKVLAVLDALTEPGAVDELGVGAIRDGFSDIFFPGTSTIQTRAKYFVLIPYILKDAMRTIYDTNEETILHKIDEEEKNCAVKMLQSGSLDDGILGRRTINAGKWLIRPPSLIYWNGLKTLDIIKEVKSIKTFVHLIAENLKKKDNKNLLKIKENEDDDGDDTDAVTIASLRLFADGLPYSHNWKEKLNIKLSRDEAVFLEQRILNAKPQSLLAYLVQKNNIVYNADSFETLYEILKDKEDLPSEMKDKMLLAVQFNHFMNIGFAVFNLALARDNETKGANKALEIIKHAQPKYAEIASINLNRIFALLHIGNLNLKNFLQTLKEKMIKGDLQGMQECVIAREKQIKRERAKVNKAGSFVDWIGLSTLDYRLNISRRILEDIKEGKNVQT